MVNWSASLLLNALNRAYNSQQTAAPSQKQQEPHLRHSIIVPNEAVATRVPLPSGASGLNLEAPLLAPQVTPLSEHEIDPHLDTDEAARIKELAKEVFGDNVSENKPSLLIENSQIMEMLNERDGKVNKTENRQMDKEIIENKKKKNELNIAKVHSQWLEIAKQLGIDSSHIVDGAEFTGKCKEVRSFTVETAENLSPESQEIYDMVNSTVFIVAVDSLLGGKEAEIYDEIHLATSIKNKFQENLRSFYNAIPELSGEEAQLLTEIIRPDTLQIQGDNIIFKFENEKDNNIISEFNNKNNGDIIDKFKSVISAKGSDFKQKLQDKLSLHDCMKHVAVDFEETTMEVDGKKVFKMQKALGDLEGLLAGKFNQKLADLGIIQDVNEGLDFLQTLDLMCQLYEAVAALHELGQLHGDIKPDNILVTIENGKLVLKIADFGKARNMQDIKKEGETLMCTGNKRWNIGGLCPETEMRAILLMSIYAGEYKFIADRAKKLDENGKITKERIGVERMLLDLGFTTENIAEVVLKSLLPNYIDIKSCFKSSVSMGNLEETLDKHIDEHVIAKWKENCGELTPEKAEQLEALGVFLKSMTSSDPTDTERPKTMLAAAQQLRALQQQLTPSFA